MSNSCKDCQQLIDWNSKAREKLNTRRPLNPDGTIHCCNIGNRTSKPIPGPNNYPNPIIKTTESKVDLSNLNVMKVIAAALQEYIALKEAGK